MRMRILLLEGDSSLGLALVRLAAQEGIAIESLDRPQEGWSADCLPSWLEEYDADVVVNLAYFHEQFQLGHDGPERSGCAGEL